MAAAMPLHPRDSGDFHAIRAQLRATLLRVRSTKGDPDSTMSRIRRTCKRRALEHDDGAEDDDEG